jgi:hypothetical protein
MWENTHSLTAGQYTEKTEALMQGPIDLEIDWTKMDMGIGAVCQRFHVYLNPLENVT